MVQQFDNKGFSLLKMSVSGIVAAESPANRHSPRRAKTLQAATCCGLLAYIGFINNGLWPGPETPAVQGSGDEPPNDRISFTPLRSVFCLAAARTS